ncbi:Protein kinase-like domain [Pseudocohnilembus persalinus]|uniref:Protein kinase-like domain n=1 Tax=Pseudocohnilembus persalinus TaxID=266149 RepID=A0A0V0R608_PSEPJ|nr:Protein kinase-like domain [Pseudocohnilembus persalinus]|eukprot:KRX09907.1 Protein kinase-like domain [Pseudocohnilembus persalinus]
MSKTNSIFVQKNKIFYPIKQEDFLTQALQKRIQQYKNNDEIQVQKDDKASNIKQKKRINYELKESKFDIQDTPIQKLLIKQEIKDTYLPDVLELKKKKWNNSTTLPQNPLLEEPHAKKLMNIKLGLADSKSVQPSKKKLYIGTESRNDYTGWNNSTLFEKNRANYFAITPLKNLQKIAQSTKNLRQQKNETLLPINYQNPFQIQNTFEKQSRLSKIADRQILSEIKQQYIFQNPDASQEKVQAAAFRLNYEQKLKSKQNENLDENQQCTFSPNISLTTNNKRNYQIKTYHSGNFEKIQQISVNSEQKKLKQKWAYSCCLSPEKNSTGCVSDFQIDLQEFDHKNDRKDNQYIKQSLNNSYNEGIQQNDQNNLKKNLFNSKSSKKYSQHLKSPDKNQNLNQNSNQENEYQNFQTTLSLMEIEELPNSQNCSAKNLCMGISDLPLQLIRGKSINIQFGTNDTYDSYDDLDSLQLCRRNSDIQRHHNVTNNLLNSQQSQQINHNNCNSNGIYQNAKRKTNLFQIDENNFQIPNKKSSQKLMPSTHSFCEENLSEESDDEYNYPTKNSFFGNLVNQYNKEGSPNNFQNSKTEKINKITQPDPNDKDLIMEEENNKQITITNNKDNQQTGQNIFSAKKIVNNKTSISPKNTQEEKLASFFQNSHIQIQPHNITDIDITGPSPKLDRRRLFSKTGIENILEIQKSVSQENLIFLKNEDSVKQISQPPIIQNNQTKNLNKEFKNLLNDTENNHQKSNNNNNNNNVNQQKQNNMNNSNQNQKMQQNKHNMIIQQKDSRFLRDYEILKIIKGPITNVFICRNKLNQQLYTIKELKLSKIKEAELYMEEIKYLSGWTTNLQNSHFVIFYSSWIEDNKLYLVMEYCTKSLRAYHQKFERPNEFTIRKILIDICSGLNVIHSKNCVHLALKPENILQSTNNKFKIADLGFAKLQVAQNDSLGLWEGDYAYVAPELAIENDENNQDEFSNLDKADIFALGAILLELMTGTDLPKSGKDWEALRNGKFKNLKSIKAYYSSTLQHLVLKMLKRDPKDRPSAKKILADLMCEEKVINQEKVKLYRNDNIKKMQILKDLKKQIEQLKKPYQPNQKENGTNTLHQQNQLNISF